MSLHNNKAFNHIIFYKKGTFLAELAMFRRLFALFRAMGAWGLRTYRQLPYIFYLLFDFGSLDFDKFDHNFDNISDFYHHHRDHQNIPLCKYSTSNQGTRYHLLHTCYLFHTQKVLLDFESKQLKIRNSFKQFFVKWSKRTCEKCSEFHNDQIKISFQIMTIQSYVKFSSSSVHLVAFHRY